MTAPPTFVATQEAAPEHIGRAGKLPRHLRDQVARRFMAEFGMTGAQAVRFAVVLLNDGSVADDSDRLANMTHDELARFIAEQPRGRKPRITRDHHLKVVAS